MTKRQRRSRNAQPQEGPQEAAQPPEAPPVTTPPVVLPELAWQPSPNQLRRGAGRCT